MMTGMPKRAVVLAGGQGTRLRPYTAVIPKPLMPVGDRPVLDIVLRASSSAEGGARFSLPPLAVAMGIYLPVTLVLPTVIGTVIGHVWNKMSARTTRPEFTARLGVLLATGMVVGDSIFGLIFAGAVGAVGDPAKLAVVGEGFALTAEWIGVMLLVGLSVATYALTKRRALQAD
jgi:hypothetical protein